MIRKGFESVDLMKLKRIGKKTTPEQQAQQNQQSEEPGKAGQKLRGEAFISRFAGLLLFIQIFLLVLPKFFQYLDDNFSRFV